MLTKVAVVASAVVVAGPLAVLPAQAMSSQAMVVGSCSAASHARLTLYRENGRIEAEFEVHSQASGQAWRVRIRHNGNLAYNRIHRIRPRRDSFSANVLVPNAAGVDVFRARAVNQVTREVCRARATF